MFKERSNSNDVSHVSLKRGGGGVRVTVRVKEMIMVKQNVVSTTIYDIFLSPPPPPPPNNLPLRPKYHQFVKSLPL